MFKNNRGLHTNLVVLFVLTMSRVGSSSSMGDYTTIRTPIGESMTGTAVEI